MTMYGYEIRNEYGLGAAELYKMADQDNPEAILEGITMAGLVGFLKQLGDLAEFAANLFNGLHEEVTNAAIRSENLTLRVQQLEEELPLIENSLCNENPSDFAYNEGISWHPNLETDTNLVTKEDMSSYVMEFYKESRGPPQLFRLDKFDVSGRGACLKRYTDPSYYKVDLVINGFTPKNLREKKAPKAMIMSNSSSIEITRSLRMSHKAKLESQIRDEKSFETPTMHVKLKPKQFKGSLLSSMQNIFETDSPSHNKSSKMHSDTNTKLNNPKETNKDSSHKRLMSLGSLIEREPNELDDNEKEAESQSSDHLSSSNQNDNKTESEGNNTDGYISEESPSENENYADALTTMVESEAESKQDSTESENPNSRISSESINIIKNMDVNKLNNKMVKKAVSMKVSFEERETKPNRKLVKDSFSHSLRHMAKQILDFKDDLTEEEFDLEENRDGFVINSKYVHESSSECEKREGPDGNLPSDDEMEMEDLIVNCENEKQDFEILEMNVMEKSDSREEMLNEERDEKKESEVLEMNVMEKLDLGEELNENGEIIENQESEIVETIEMEKLDIGDDLNENGKTDENEESETLETIKMENSDFGEELQENESQESKILETVKMEDSDFGEELLENESQEAKILETMEMEKLDIRRELNGTEEKDEILESKILETNEVEKLGSREELHENEETNEIQDSEILEPIDMKKLEHGEELHENEKTNLNHESEILENVEIEKFGSSEELRENEETYEIQKSQILESNEMEKLDYKFHKNVETNKMHKFDFGEELCESEEPNEIPDFEILESNEKEKSDLRQNFNGNKEINETEKSDFDSGEELHEREKPNEIPEFKILESIDTEKFDSREETKENEMHMDSTVTENLIKEEYFDNDISNPQILESIELENLDLSEEKMDLREETTVMESDEIMMDDYSTSTKKLIMKHELLDVETSSNIEIDLDMKSTIDQYEHQKEEAGTSSPVSENITSPVHSDLVKETKHNSELKFEDISFSYNETMDLSKENEIPESQIQNSIKIPNSDREQELQQSNSLNIQSAEITINDMINKILITKDFSVNTQTSLEPLTENKEEPETSSPVITNSVNFEDIFFSYGLSIPLPSISNQQNSTNSTKIIAEQNNNNNQEQPLPPLPPVQWRTGKPPAGTLSNFGKLGRPPRPKPSRGFPKMAKNQSVGQINFQEGKNEQARERREIIHENEALPNKERSELIHENEYLPNKESEGVSEVFDSLPTLDKDASMNGISNDNNNNNNKTEEILHVENNGEEREIKLEEFSTGDLKFLSELEKNEKKKKSPPVPPPFKYPLFQFTSHDKTMFKKAPKLIQPSNRLITPSMLEEIRNRSFRLKPVLIRKPNLTGQHKRTNLKVAAMLEKAHAIRQAVASDDSDNDSWSE